MVGFVGTEVYTGTTFPEWHGDLLVVGLSRGYLVRLDLEGREVRAAEYLLEDAPVRLRNVKQAPDGALYLLTDERDGRLLRLDRAGFHGAGADTESALTNAHS